MKFEHPHATTPEHRAAILARIGEVWSRAPFLRLGQLLSNAENFHTPNSLFYVQDVDLAMAVDKWLSNLERMRTEMKERSDHSITTHQKGPL